MVPVVLAAIGDDITEEAITSGDSFGNKGKVGSL